MAKKIATSLLAMSANAPNMPFVALYKVCTTPDIDQIWQHLDNISLNFAKALSGIKAVEHQVYPLINIAEKYKYIARPDHKKALNLVDPQGLTALLVKEV